MFSSCAWSQAVDFSLFITVHSLHPLMLTIREALGWMAHVCNHLKWPQSLTDLRENSRSSSGGKKLIDCTWLFMYARVLECVWMREMHTCDSIKFLVYFLYHRMSFLSCFLFCLCGDFRPKTPFSFFFSQPIPPPSLWHQLQPSYSAQSKHSACAFHFFF